MASRGAALTTDRAGGGPVGGASVSDEDLLRRHLAGADGALRELLERHQGWVRGYLLGRCGDRDVADDLSQEVFVRVVRSAGTYRFRARFTTWLFAITTNVWRRHLARRRRERALAVVRTALRPWLGPEEAGPAPLEAVPDPRPGADRALEGREQVDALRAALRRLPEAQRRAVLLVKVQGLSIQEASRVMDVNENTVKTNVRRGRLRLAEALGEGGSRGTDLGGAR